MKHLSLLIVSILLSNQLVAEQIQQKSDLEFKSISYINNSIPTLSINLSGNKMNCVGFIIAYANNYFDTDRYLVNEQSREHIYIGFNYNF